MTDIVEELRNPMWAHSNITFESPQLEQEENLAAMRAAADEIERLREALQFIADGYDNQDVNHVDYRVKVYQVALDALSPLTPADGKTP